MSAYRSSHSRLLAFAAVAALALLGACGRTDSSAQAVPGAANVARCFVAVGSLDDKDATLFAAAQSGDVPEAEQAIAAGANVNAADRLKRTPLLAAAFCNRPSLVNLLIDKGSEVNAGDFDRLSPLHAAVIVGGGDAAKALIARGANVNGRNADGRTPLHLAAATNQPAMIDLLVAHGAHVGARDKDGNTAAALAIRNGHKTVAARLHRKQEREAAPSKDHNVSPPPAAPLPAVPQGAKAG